METFGDQLMNRSTCTPFKERMCRTVNGRTYSKAGAITFSSDLRTLTFFSLSVLSSLQCVGIAATAVRMLPFVLARGAAYHRLGRQPHLIDCSCKTGNAFLHQTLVED